VVNPKQLILVDGSSYLFRAFHALPPLVSSKGQPTGAVKGVINMIRSLIKSNPDSNIAIVFDAKGQTFRNRIFEEYKAHRPPMPDELRSQIQPIHDIIRAMGLPLLIVDDVEADDVIGTLSKRACEAGIKTLISTGDKDLAQLVNDDVTLMNTMTNEVLDSDGVEQKFGVGPNRIVDYLALMGDKSDNIPGVPGVGPKTALKWLLDFGKIDDVIANADAIGGKIGERLRENIDMVRLSYELATIKLDVELDIEIADLVPGEADSNALHALYSEMEFKTWVRELEESGISGGMQPAKAVPVAGEATSTAVIATAPDKIDYKTITTGKDFDKLLQRLRSADKFSLTLEAEDTHYLEARIIGVGLCLQPGEAWYLPLAHDYEGCPPLLNPEACLQALREVLENPAISKIAYDLKRCGHLLANHGITLQPFKSDVLLASYVVNSVATRHGLSDIARNYLDIALPELESLLGKGKTRLTVAQVPIATYTNFAAAKADMTLRLSLRLEQEMQNNGQLFGLYQYYEVPLVEVLQGIERNGIKVDALVLAKQSKELGKQLQKLEAQACELAGEEFNLGSPKQMQSIFYEKLGLPVIKKTKTGQPSTAEPILQELALEYELPRVILEHRSLSKLKSTYTDKLPLEIRAETGRIHSTFQQAVAATGRLSSTDPNLQNIPIRTAEGRRVRKAFVSEPGYKLVAADYSQVELRIMAHLSQDKGLLTAFSNAADVHRATAADVFNLALDEVTPEQRRSAKAINFGLIYGMSAFGLANQLKISRREAQDYVDRYFEKYPGVLKYMEQTQALADEKGYVETLFGRRLYLPDIHAGNAILRKAAQRTAINAPMQGTAADIIKRAMIDIDHWLAMGELDARMILQVHDELVFEVSQRDVQLLSDGVRFRMITAAALDVPLVVDIGIGENWDEAH
jgi:DNA polymerase-1